MENDNIQFFAIVELLDTMCEKGMLQRNPENKDHVIVYRTGLDIEKYGVSEGFVSQHLFDVATELKLNENHEREGFCNALEQEGFQPVFDENGNFSELLEISREKNRKMER